MYSVCWDPPLDNEQCKGLESACAHSATGQGQGDRQWRAQAKLRGVLGKSQTDSVGRRRGRPELGCMGRWGLWQVAGRRADYRVTWSLYNTRLGWPSRCPRSLARIFRVYPHGGLNGVQSHPPIIWSRHLTLEAASLEECPLWEWRAEWTFQGRGGVRTSACPGPAHRSTSHHILSKTSSSN